MNPLWKSWEYYHCDVLCPFMTFWFWKGHWHVFPSFDVTLIDSTKDLIEGNTTPFWSSGILTVFHSNHFQKISATFQKEIGPRKIGLSTHIGRDTLPYTDTPSEKYLANNLCEYE